MQHMVHMSPTDITFSRRQHRKYTGVVEENLLSFTNCVVAPRFYTYITPSGLIMTM